MNEYLLTFSITCLFSYRKPIQARKADVKESDISCELKLTQWFVTATQSRKASLFPCLSSFVENIRYSGDEVHL